MSEQTLREAVEKYLFQSTIFDAVPWNQFQNFFPTEYRLNPQVRKLYKDYQKQRKEIKEQIADRIKEEYADEEHSSEANVSIDEALEFLKKEEEALETELDIVNASLDASKKIIEGFQGTIEELDRKTSSKNQAPFLESFQSELSQMNSKVEQIESILL